ncbi:MAG: hypothetical protein H7249_20505 [Chitinophagaceae bacterium]|nr:hypothetical protein [Oligoflexus sp.]
MTKMKTFLFFRTFTTLGLALALSHTALGADAAKSTAKAKTKAEAKAKVAETSLPKEKVEIKSDFAVQDMPAPEPIKGQLGEPGAPSLKDQQDALAKSLLAKGLCNESYYGAEFCEKQQKRTFKVNSEVGIVTPDSDLVGAKTEDF